jgi:hypothetical protein
VDDAALGGRRGDAVNWPQKQRMMGDEKIGANGDGLVDDNGNRVHGEEDPAHVGLGIPTDQTDRIPGFGPSRVVQLVEDCNDVGEARHGRRLRGRGPGEELRL